MPTRRAIIAALCLVGLAIAAVLVFVIASGGSSSHKQASGRTRSGPGVDVAGIPNPMVVETRQVRAGRGFTYRLELVTVTVPRSTPPTTPEPYYSRLSVRRGHGPFSVVETKQLPYQFTASSVVQQFTLDSNKDGSDNVGLSWYVKNGDTNDVTHYFTVVPTGVVVN